MQPRWIFSALILVAVCGTNNGFAADPNGKGTVVRGQNPPCQCQYCVQQRMGGQRLGTPIGSEPVMPAAGQMMAAEPYPQQYAQQQYEPGVMPAAGTMMGAPGGYPAGGPVTYLEGGPVTADAYGVAWDGTTAGPDAGRPAPAQSPPVNADGYFPGYANCTSSYCDTAPMAGPTNCFSGYCGRGCYGCTPPMVIASAEATFFFPQFSRGFLTTGVSNGVNGLQSASTNTSNGSTEGVLLAAPRITLGLQGDCWGIVTRYWYASSWATGFTPAVANSGIPGVTAFDGFNAYTWDLELQRRICVCDWTLYASGGLRYAAVKNDRSIAINDISGGNVFQASSFSSQQFSGTGLTFGLMGIRPIWCGCPWSIYASNRYSILWGNSGVTAQTSATAASDGFASSTNGGFTSGAANLFIAEVQAGLQWDAELKCLPGRRAFLRGGFEFQYWNSSSNASASAFSIAANTPGQGTFATSQAGNFLFSLIGISVGTGILY